MKIVNLEFPLSRMGEALTVLANIIEPVGLHLHGVSEPSGDNDSGIQVKTIAYTNASAYQWFTFCMLFNQDCVALSYDGVTGVCVGPMTYRTTYVKLLKRTLKTLAAKV